MIPSSPLDAIPTSFGEVLHAFQRISTLAASSRTGDEVLCEVLDEAARGMGWQGAALSLVDRSGGTLDGVCASGTWALTPGSGGAPCPGEAEQRVARTGRSAAADDGCLVVPVWSHERIVGTLSVDPSPGGFPGETQMELIRVVAGQIGVIVENHGLHDANEGKIRQLLALQRLGREMTSTLDLTQLLSMVVEEAAGLTGAEGGRLYLLDPSTEELRLEAWSGTAPGAEDDVFLVGQGTPGWVACSGKAVRRSEDDLHEGNRRNHLAVPLRSEAQVVGVLGVEGGEEAGFTDAHEEILSIFAAQAAKALEAARFFQQLRQERDLRDEILAGTPNGIVALDPERRVRLMNPAARLLLGVKDEPLGNPVGPYLLVPAFGERLDLVLAGASHLESFEMKVGPGEGGRLCLVSLFALPWVAGTGATVVIQDLTERKRLGERVQRMSRLASIGQLAAGIAHEIRNPLTGVAISLDILREEEGISPGGRDLLTDINREIDRLEALIRGLLDFARPRPVEPRPMRVAKALEWRNTFDSQCRKRGVTFRCILGDNPKVRGDPEKLKQVFLNLALNALDATPPQGEIRITAGTHDDGDHRWVRVVVEDTGRGMAPDTEAHAFDPFFTTKHEGTGLGLSIAHSLIDQHGGRIDLDTAPGRGARFVVDLPPLEGEKE